MNHDTSTVLLNQPVSHLPASDSTDEWLPDEAVEQQADQPTQDGTVLPSSDDTAQRDELPALGQTDDRTSASMQATLRRLNQHSLRRTPSPAEKASEPVKEPVPSLDFSDDDPYRTSLHHDLIARMTAWLRLFVQPGEAVELRALEYVDRPGQNPRTASGFFDDHHLDQMAEEALRVSQTSKGVYFTLNPLNPDLLSRRFNRVDVAKDDLASDQDVLVRRWLLVDVDPCRISGVSATAAEKDKARRKMEGVRHFLKSQGWPDPVVADSGNGFHLLYRIDMPSSAGDVVKGVLHALGNRFDDAAVKVDRSVFNAARIVKLYGTKARKGDDTADRPHRWTEIIEVPEDLRPVPVAVLKALAAEVPEVKVPDRSPALQEYEVQPSSMAALRQRARNLLLNIPGAVSGEHGHDRTFRAACLLVKGLGLPIQEAMTPLKEWNERCQPPWGEKDLLHKLADAARQPGPVGYLLGIQKQPDQMASSFKAQFIDCATLDAEAMNLRWLVKKVFVANQPMVVGGPKKALKTSLVTDLAVSLASGTPFLNKFAVPAPVKVVFLSGETGKATQRDTARRVCQAKGIHFRDCNIAWGFELPQLSNDRDLSALTIGLAEVGAEAVFIDPLYLCLLYGNTNVQASNMYQMGPLLLRVGAACLQAGATPVLVHHARKENQMYRGSRNEPLDLEDLAFSGIAEFARQWVMISRREKYDHEKGEHKLWLNIGGSAGHSSCYGVDVVEGQLADDFGGRRWEVYVVSGEQAVKELKEKKTKQKEVAKHEKELEEREQIVKVLRHHPDGETQETLAEETGISKRRLVERLHEMLDELVVCRCGLTKPFGDKGAAKTHKAWRLYPEPTQAEAAGLSQMDVSELGKVLADKAELDKLLRQGVCLADAVEALTAPIQEGEETAEKPENHGTSKSRSVQKVRGPGARTRRRKHEK